MPRNAERKRASRQRILEAAATCFTRRGFDAVSIDEVMAVAGMTRGGFYAHFTSKSALYASALRHAATQGAERLDSLAGPQLRIDTYLRQSADQANAVCPLACLVSDVAQRDERVRTTYTALLEGFLERFQMPDAGGPDARQRALKQAVAMIGSLAIARTVNDSQLTDELLAAGRELAADAALPGKERPAPAPPPASRHDRQGTQKAHQAPASAPSP